MNWNKINWEKITKIQKSCEDKIGEFDYDKFWKIMSEVSGMDLEKDESNFTWENGYNAGLPREDGKFYLIHTVKDDTTQIGIYDALQDYDPCFWSFDYEECLHPDYWTEIEKPNVG
jgi:predicted nucleotidyltransferase